MAFNETCDRHPSAKANAKITFPSGGVLYTCQHCANTLNFGEDFLLEYADINISHP